MAAGQSYPKAARLTRRREYLRVQGAGRRRHSEHFVVVCMPGATDETRLGITVSARIGNAVLRNGVKRRVRELYRRERSRLPGGLDVVVIAKPGAGSLSQAEVSQELRAAFESLPTS